MKIRLLSFILLLIYVFLNLDVLATPSKLFGKEPSYAQTSVELYTYHDFITEEKIRLGNINFGSDGSFELNLEIQGTTLAMADFDGIHGMIYLEPGKTYEVAFPPKQSLSEGEKRNPFAKPDPVWFGLKNANKNELNYQIQHFEQEYSILENKYFDQIYGGQSKNLVDTVKLKLVKLFPKTTNQFFEAHKHFRNANLDFALNQGKSKDFMENYFCTVRPVGNLAAYSIIFNQTFSNYFEKLNTATNNKKFREIFGSINLQKLDNYLEEELHFNKELSHLVILKSLSEAYYSKQFAKKSILSLLRQTNSAAWSEYEQEISKIIHQRLIYLSSGTIPPTLTLKNLNGQKVSLSDFKNEYIYLHFTDPKNPICRQHLMALKTTANLYKEKLTIINVIPNAKDFKNDSNWPGIFTTSETNIESSFKVKTYPTSFLIGKDGRLLLSPAPNPIDGFDRQMGQILKSDYIKDLQKGATQPIK